MLPRGEQRAMLLLSLLLIMGVMARVTVQLLPARDPPGMDKFVTASRLIMDAFEKADSLKESANCLPGTTLPGPSPSPRYASQAQPININIVDSAQLLPLPGVGPVFAGRIIKYRNLLGGFTNIDQLDEVYGLKQEIIHLITDRLYFDTTSIRAMNVNLASFRDLLRHPYLQMEDVKTLVKYRDFNGGIGSLREIEANELLPDSTLEKVSPYLEFNH